MNYVRNTFFSLALLVLVAPSAFASSTETAGSTTEKQPLFGPENKPSWILSQWNGFKALKPVKATTNAVAAHKYVAGGLSAAALVSLATYIAYKKNATVKAKLDAFGTWSKAQWAKFQANKTAKTVVGVVAGVGAAVVAGYGIKKGYDKYQAGKKAAAV